MQTLTADYANLAALAPAGVVDAASASVHAEPAASVHADVADAAKKPHAYGQKQGGQPSGWLNKCAKLLVAIDGNDWGTVYSLAGEYKHVETMKRILDNTASTSNKKHKGRGW
jgi:hypothetical protein